jgi:hypothetical protein
MCVYKIEKFRTLSAALEQIYIHFTDSCMEWYFWLVTLNSLMNPWIYIALNRDLQLSLYYCCCPCWRTEDPSLFPSSWSKDSAQGVPVSGKVIPPTNFRPRSYTTSHAHLDRSTLIINQTSKVVIPKRTAFSNGRNPTDYYKKTNTEIPMRCRLNTFQL